MLRVLTFVDAVTVTSPVKNLLGFCQAVRGGGDGSGDPPCVDMRLAIYHRCADPGGQPPPLAQACRQRRIPLEVIPERKRFDRAVLAAMKALVERHRPDIVETHGVKPHFLARLAGLRRGRRWVAFHHGYTAIDLKDRAYAQLDRWSLRGPDAVVTVCRAFARDLARRGVPAGRIRVLHNDIDVGPEMDADALRAAATRRQASRPGGERVVLAVGRLSREKGHADLLEAVALLARMHPGLRVRTVLVGDGPERERLQARAGRLGIGERVEFAGQQADVRPFYRRADVLAMPSHSEGSSNVLLEAMALGVPIVATRVGGVPEMLADRESALLAPSRRPAALCDALEALLLDADLADRLAECAGRQVRTRHAPEARRVALLEIYREVLARPAPSGPGARGEEVRTW